MGMLSGLQGINKFLRKGTDLITGQTQVNLQEKAQKLAEESQSFNESYSQKQLEQTQEQFNKSQELAEKNLAFQKESADKNFQMQQDVFNAQQRENELTRQREDTAYQRSVADLKAAGLSPLMASSGASASTMEVGSAPQYDSSGIGNAFGSYIQMAKEYAELKNMTQGNYLSRRQQAINERIGASIALSQLYESRRQMFANNALSGFNLAANVQHLRKQNALIDEQIQTAKDSRNWNNVNGWRNETLANYLVSIIDKIVPPTQAANIVSQAIDKAKNSSQAVNNVVESVNNLPKVAESVKESVVKKVERTKKDIKIITNIHTNKNALKARYALSNEKRQNALKALYSDYSEIISEYGINMNQFKKLSAKQVNQFIANPMEFLRNWK